MTYIRCPECGQKALSVATRCPKCGFVLSQNPMISGGTGGLVECRNCRKLISQGVPECPYCGHSTWWDSRRVTGAVIIAIATVVAIGGFLVLASRGNGASQTPAIAAPAPQHNEPETPGATPSPPQFAADTAPVVSQPEAPAVDSSAVSPAPPTANASPSGEQTPVPVPGPAGSLVVRWTTNWVNLRRGPGISYTVLDVFRPGTRIEVGRPQGGWWPAYRNGVMVGYVSGSELSTVPPN